MEELPQQTFLIARARDAHARAAKADTDARRKEWQDLAEKYWLLSKTWVEPKSCVLSVSIAAACNTAQRTNP